MGVPKHSLRKRVDAAFVLHHTHHIFELSVLQLLHFRVCCIYRLHLVVLERMPWLSHWLQPSHLKTGFDIRQSNMNNLSWFWTLTEEYMRHSQEVTYLACVAIALPFTAQNNSQWLKKKVLNNSSDSKQTTVLCLHSLEEPEKYSLCEWASRYDWNNCMMQTADMLLSVRRHLFAHLTVNQL